MKTVTAKGGKVSDRLTIMVGANADVVVIYGLNKRITEHIVRMEMKRMSAGQVSVK